LNQNQASQHNELSYSVIIPTLNESSRIVETVLHVHRQQPAAQLIVVDGGSDDNTCVRAREAGAMVITAPRGRGTQCAAGAQAATGEILVFVHADTQLPDRAFTILSQQFTDPEVRIGTFRLRFDHDHWLLRLYAFWSRFDSVLTRFGDQVIVVRRDFYEQIGGFPDWLMLEDVHLLRCARRCTRVHSFPAEVTTSARRYHKNGLLRNQLRNSRIMLAYLFGPFGRAS